MRVKLPARENWDFGDRVLVSCSACGAPAVVEPRGEVRRMACRGCAKMIEGPLLDLTLGQPVRLRIETRAGTLFAYNEAHLDYIEAFIAADIREEVISPGGIRNRSILSRLPAWAKSAKNREEVLRAIARARTELD